jgi:hypothetical protein
MIYPFPGMDPYLEHPVLWESVHARLIPSLANQLQPLLDPRYVATIEERGFVEGPQQRIPDIWVQKIEPEATPSPSVAVEEDTAIILEVEDLEVHQKRVEILDSYNGMKLVAIVEVVSPTNKRPGPGRESYLRKQAETLARDCHFIEIDLHRHGDHVLSVPEWRVEELKPYDYLCCVSRWPWRNRFALYCATLRQKLPSLRLPLLAPDPDVILDVQKAVEDVYRDGRYGRRIRYDEPCVPALGPENQAWAEDQRRRAKTSGNGAS